MINWKKKLNKKQRNHVRESIDGPVTLEKIRNNVLAQRDNIFPCWDCVDIGRRLGIKVDLVKFHDRIK